MEPLIGFGLGCFQTFVDQSVFLLGKLDELGEAVGLRLSKEMGLEYLSPREAVSDGMDQAVNVVDGSHGWIMRFCRSFTIGSSGAG